MINYLKKFNLESKTAFVVGGLGLIGKEVSMSLATAGAKVVMLDIDKKAAKILIRNSKEDSHNLNFEFFNCSDMDLIEKNYFKIISKYGCPDVFINCSYPRTDDWSIGSFEDISLNTFRKNVDIHMNSFIWLSRLTAESMKKEKINGSIIQLGSIYGILGQDLTVYKGTKMKENMAYSAIKGGITNLTRQMASYYGQYNIRVNTLVSGGLKGHVAGESEVQNSIFVKKYSNKVPLKRLGLPEEIASSVLFLSSEASSYITGTALIVDGGWSIV